MNKGFDFSVPGKFPVTQENLDWMQQGTAELLKWLSWDDANETHYNVRGVC